MEREFLATIDYAPGVTRIPIKRLQELRCNRELWSLCKAALSRETPRVGRLLRFKDGLPAQKGSIHQVGHDYLDFGGSLEYIRVQMAAGEYGA